MIQQNKISKYVIYTWQNHVQDGHIVYTNENIVEVQQNINVCTTMKIALITKMH